MSKMVVSSQTDIRILFVSPSIPHASWNSCKVEWKIAEVKPNAFNASDVSDLTSETAKNDSESQQITDEKMR